MRKGFERLYGLVRDRLGQDPLSGDLFLFTNPQSALDSRNDPLGPPARCYDNRLYAVASGRRLDSLSMNLAHCEGSRRPLEFGSFRPPDGVCATKLSAGFLAEHQLFPRVCRHACHKPAVPMGTLS